MARPRGSAWQGALKTKDKYYRYSFPTEKLAEEWEKKAKAAYEAGLEIPPPDYSRKRPTLASFYEDHHNDIWPYQNKKNVKNHQRACERMLGASTYLSSIDQKKLTLARSEERKKGNSGSTWNTRMSHLKKLLLYAKGLHEIDTLPEIPWDKDKSQARMRFFTEAEERKIIALFKHWGLLEMSQMVEFLVDTGCRPGEVLLSTSEWEPLKWSEVSKSAGGEAPDIEDPKTGEVKAVVSLMRTKTGKFRVLPLTDRAKAALLASKERGEYRPFGDVKVDTLSNRFREVCIHLELEDAVLYTLRHTCASRLVQRGAELLRVKTWMGHTDIASTLRYAKLTPTDIFELEHLL